MNKLIIGEIKKVFEEDMVKIMSVIKREEDEFALWFGYPRTYENYVCNERSDSFLVAILPYALKNGCDIVCVNSVSEQLMYQINNYYIPIMAKYQKEYTAINVQANTDNKNYNYGNAVGTGCSCGVDSFYAVFKHLENDIPNDYQLTHLVSMNVGSFGTGDANKSLKWFEEQLLVAERVANKLSLPLIRVDSNLQEFYVENHASSGTFRMAGAILGIQKLFSCYYVASGFDIKDFNISAEDNDDYDMFNLICATNESTKFYSSGLESTRHERTKYISKHDVTYDSLVVCFRGIKNCGNCEKCLRTIGSLYVEGELDKYKEVFSLNKFYKKKIFYLSKIRFYGIGYMKPLYKEIYMCLKRKEPVVYIVSCVLAVLFIAPMEFAKKFIKEVLPKSLYRKIKLKMNYDPNYK